MGRDFFEMAVPEDPQIPKETFLSGGLEKSTISLKHER